MKHAHRSPRLATLAARDSLDGLVYTAGLHMVQEAVVSSHFMQRLATNPQLEVYDEGEFAAKALSIDAGAVYGTLIPSMVKVSQAFAAARAAAAWPRARANYRDYGLGDPREVGVAQCVTEVMFDRQYLRGPRRTCSRRLLCDQVQRRVDECAAIEMVIPALPFKFSSPLQTRGQLPDLAEVNFVLGLYEIAATIEHVYRKARPQADGPLARFTVVSDGSRFNHLVNERDGVVESYLAQLRLWIERLQLGSHVKVVDYRALLRDRLPPGAWEAKSAITARARAEYEDALWPIFDPCDMASTLRAAACVELDPEYSNPEGRFVSLLKSLIYTVNYRALEGHRRSLAASYSTFYRDLTGHLFEPYATLPASQLEGAHTTGARERLRQSMLAEVWACAIDYIAEIKSDRELGEDPILICLPDHFRWTIHAKPGQLAVLTPSAMGAQVQAWAGAAVFRRTKKDKVKLCTLPVLALEGAGAVPVTMRGCDDALARTGQPLFYIYPDVACDDLGEFVARVTTTLVRKRTT